MKILGLPTQFIAVVIVSIALTIFIGAWAADANVESRAQQLYTTGGAPSLGGMEPLAPGAVDGAAAPDASGQKPEVEKEVWESAFLFACPLH